ncbi:hypothetical protein ACU4GD_09030 [Cupriavidus basilensis]
MINQFQPRASLPLQLVEELVGEGLPVLNSRLSSSVKIRESHQHAMPMIHLDPRHKLALEIFGFASGVGGIGFIERCWFLHPKPYDIPLRGWSLFL